MTGNLHDGHRERVRKEFFKNGIDENTPPHKVVEMLLFFGFLRKDSNTVAHELLNRFGSVSGILEAPAEYLMKVPGVGENTAALIKLILPLMRIYMNEKGGISKLPDLNSSKEKLCEFLQNKAVGMTKEAFTVVSLNAQNKLISCDTLGNGNASEVTVSVRSIVENVLMHNAISVIIAHNHPEGFALPSPADVDVTKLIKNALDHIGVRLIDHIIVTSDDYVSMAESRSFSYIFE